MANFKTFNAFLASSNALYKVSNNAHSAYKPIASLDIYKSVHNSDSVVLAQKQDRLAIFATVWWDEKIHQSIFINTLCG